MGRPVPGIRNIIAVASGKGGVGKSTVSLNLALALARIGNTGYLDSDLYGPSLPAMVGYHAPVEVDAQKHLVPHEIYGLKMMSLGFLAGRYEPVTWRGPMLHKMLQQFLYGTAWGELDFLVLDLPPGTGDVQLTLTQSSPLSAALLVTTPQEVALRDVVKGYEMFHGANIPVLGIVENMSFFTCGGCAKKHRPFGEGGAHRLAESYGLPLLAELPLDLRVPSPLGRGEPLMVREEETPLAAMFHDLAARVNAALKEITPGWAMPDPGGMEV